MLALIYCIVRAQKHGMACKPSRFDRWIDRHKHQIDIGTWVILFAIMITVCTARKHRIDEQKEKIEFLTPPQKVVNNLKVV